MAKDDQPGFTFEWITYPLLFVYFLPILFIYCAAWSSSLFLDENSATYFARAVSGSYYENLRATLGTILMPFVTAFAIKEGVVARRVPVSTMGLFGTLLAIFVSVTVLYAMVEYRQVELSRVELAIASPNDTKSAYAVFQGTLMTYAKETLGYLALVLGVSLRQFGSGTGGEAGAGGRGEGGGDKPNAGGATGSGESAGRDHA